MKRRGGIGCRRKRAATSSRDRRNCSEALPTERITACGDGLPRHRRLLPSPPSSLRRSARRSPPTTTTTPAAAARLPSRAELARVHHRPVGLVRRAVVAIPLVGRGADVQRVAASLVRPPPLGAAAASAPVDSLLGRLDVPAALHRRRASPREQWRLRRAGVPSEQEQEVEHLGPGPRAASEAVLFDNFTSMSKSTVLRDGCLVRSSRRFEVALSREEAARSNASTAAVQWHGSGRLHCPRGDPTVGPSLYAQLRAGGCPGAIVSGPQPVGLSAGSARPARGGPTIRTPTTSARRRGP